MTENSSFNGVLSRWAATFSLVKISVSDWKASMMTTRATASANQAERASPSSSVSQAVMGTSATTIAKRPMLAQIRATTPIFSRSFCSCVSEGSIDQ